MANRGQSHIYKAYRKEKLLHKTDWEKVLEDVDFGDLDSDTSTSAVPVSEPEVAPQPVPDPPVTQPDYPPVPLPQADEGEFSGCLGLFLLLLLCVIGAVGALEYTGEYRMSQHIPALQGALYPATPTAEAVVFLEPTAAPTETTIPGPTPTPLPPFYGNLRVDHAILWCMDSDSICSKSFMTYSAEHQGITPRYGCIRYHIPEGVEVVTTQQTYDRPGGMIREGDGIFSVCPTEYIRMD